MKTSGELVNVDGKWGLSLWYPAARKLEVTERPKKTHKRGRPKGANAGGHSGAEYKSAGPPIGSPKLTAEQVEQIKTRSVAGEPRTKLAKEFGISRSSVWGIVTGRTWKSATATGVSETEGEPKLHAVG
jgi:DNA invertase Pin-like site-specific DNA recombinase